MFMICAVRHLGISTGILHKIWNVGECVGLGNFIDNELGFISELSCRVYFPDGVHQTCWQLTSNIPSTMSVKVPAIICLHWD